MTLFEPDTTERRGLTRITSVAIQGGENSYHGDAARILVPGAELNGHGTFEGVIGAVTNHEVHAGILATGSNHARVNEELELNLKMISEAGLEPITETELDVIFALYGLKGALPYIKTVRSQPVARWQCEPWLYQNMPGINNEDADDGLMAMDRLANEPDRTIATIGRITNSLPGGIVRLEDNIGEGNTWFTLFGLPGLLENLE